VAKVLSGGVALVVYRAAIAAFPASLPFRARFLQLLGPLSFPGRAAIEVSGGRGGRGPLHVTDCWWG
jgi:hypothetical protein